MCFIRHLRMTLLATFAAVLAQPVVAEPAQPVLIIVDGSGSMWGKMEGDAEIDDVVEQQQRILVLNQNKQVSTRIAVERARALTGVDYAGKEIIIIGDTPLDVACGRHLGVRTVAVATGKHPVDELAACDPDHVFPDLGDVDAAWAAIVE